MRDFFSDLTNKGSNIFGGKLRSIFREKIRASKKSIRPHFVLQTCHRNLTEAKKNKAVHKGNADSVPSFGGRKI